MIEDALKPFRRDESAVMSRHMNVHGLPWLSAELRVLGHHEVELRVRIWQHQQSRGGMTRGWRMVPCSGDQLLDASARCTYISIYR